MYQSVFILTALIILSACGAGNTSSSSIAALAARACLELQRSTSSSVVINNCDYAVNITELEEADNLIAEPFLVKANSQRDINRRFVNWGACRSPYVVEKEGGFSYRCRKN